MDFAFRTAADLAAATRRGTVGCRELLDHHLARVERLNPRVNAIVTLDVERARRCRRALESVARRMADVVGGFERPPGFE